MKTREHYLFRAACLREIQEGMDDPVARKVLEALIQELDNAAHDAARLMASPVYQ